MSAQDWLDMASVYRASANAQRGYSFNPERQQQADAADAMADRCEDIAVERGAAAPPPSAYRRHRERQRHLRDATTCGDGTSVWGASNDR